MARDLLDVDLLILVEELERAAVHVRTLREGWPWLARCGVQAAVLADELSAAALRGRDAVTAKADADYDWRESEAHGVDLAKEAVRLQSAMLSALRGLEALQTNDVRDDLPQLRAALRLKSPRLQTALNQARIWRDLLAHPDQRVVHHEPGIDMAVRVQRLLGELEAAHQARVTASRRRLAANRGWAETREELVRVARRFRRAWEQAWVWSGERIPPFVFELAAAAHAQRRREEEPQITCSPVDETAATADVGPVEDKAYA